MRDKDSKAGRKPEETTPQFRKDYRGSALGISNTWDRRDFIARVVSCFNLDARREGQGWPPLLFQ